MTLCSRCETARTRRLQWTRKRGLHQTGLHGPPRPKVRHIPRPHQHRSPLHPRVRPGHHRRRRLRRHDFHKVAQHTQQQDRRHRIPKHHSGTKNRAHEDAGQPHLGDTEGGNSHHRSGETNCDIKPFPVQLPYSLSVRRSFGQR